MWIFLPITVHRTPAIENHRPKLGLRSPTSNAIIVFSLRPFTCKDLLQYFGKCKQVFFLLLVIVMDSIKSNVSVNFVEGIQ